MSTPLVPIFDQFLLLVGDGATPELFPATNMCGFKQKSLTLTQSSSEASVPDCDTPSAPTWTQRAPGALSAEVRGSGVMTVAGWAFWRAWMLGGGLPKNCRMAFQNYGLYGPDMTGNQGYYAGKFILTNLAYSTQLQSDANQITTELTMASTGGVVWTPTV